MRPPFAVRDRPLLTIRSRRYFCENCGKKRDALRYTELAELPPVRSTFLRLSGSPAHEITFRSCTFRSSASSGTWRQASEASRSTP